MAVRAGGLLARMLLTVLCSVGLLAMHQMVASAHPMQLGTAHDMVATGMPTAHGCAGHVSAVTTSTTCTLHQACQAMPASSRMAPSPAATPLAVVPTPHDGPVACGPGAGERRSGDPPDLSVLSVSRT